MASITNSSLLRLSASLTDRFFECGIFTDDDQHFVPHDDGDRFVRPLDPLPLSDFDRLIEPITKRPYQTRGFFPSIGTSWDEKYLYLGLRVRGFGADGIAEASAIWQELQEVHNLKLALSFAFEVEWASLEECWIAYSYLSDLPVNGYLDAATIAQLVERLVTFTLRLRDNNLHDFS